MNDYLNQHPEIFMCKIKESHFLGTDLYSLIKDESEYLQLFSEARDEKRIGESSVWYLYSKHSAQEIEAFCPSARIIIMLRSPVDMIYSLHSQLLYVGIEDLEDFEEALSVEEDRKKGLRLPEKPSFIEGLFYREVGKYTDQVQRYVDVFGWEKIKIIIYDDFKSDTAGSYRETCEFLGVDSEFEPEFRVINPNKRVRSKAARSFLADPPRIMRKLIYCVAPVSLAKRS